MSREKFHQEIAQLLQEKVKNPNIKWIADANGITCQIGSNLTGNEGYQEGAKLFNAMFAGLKSQVKPNDLPNAYRAEVLRYPPYLAAYTEPSRLIDLLNSIGQNEKAEEYNTLIKKENSQIASNLNKLMEKENIQWRADINGVFCTHIQKTPKDKHEKEGRAAGVTAFKDTLSKYKITSIPKTLEGVLGINSRTDIQPGLVKIKARYGGGQKLEALNKEIDTALASEVKTPTPKDSLAGIRQPTLEANIEKKPSLKEVNEWAGAIGNKILAFCEDKRYSNATGLQKMRKIMDSPKSIVGPKATLQLQSMINLAKSKKSDTDFMRKFHEVVRGRKPEVEEFYRKLADLNLDKLDEKTAKEFMAHIDKDLKPKLNPDPTPHATTSMK